MHEMSKWEFVLNNPEWVAIVVTTVLAVIAVVQLFFLIRSANAARDAAKAANVNADAVMKSERAWVIATPVNWNPELAVLAPPSTLIPLNIFDIAIKSVGKTPAQLIDIVNQYVSIESLGGLPVPPEYGTPAPLDGLLLVPEDSFSNRTVLNPTPTLNPETHIRVMNAERFLYAFGRVRYRDTFGLERETRWGYVYDFPQGLMVSIREPRFQRAGPPEYNKST
jgi:hypothetical protein